MEADASEAGELRKLLEQQTGQRVAGFVGLMLRNMALDILRTNVPPTSLNTRSKQASNGYRSCQ